MCYVVNEMVLVTITFGSVTADDAGCSWSDSALQCPCLPCYYNIGAAPHCITTTNSKGCASQSSPSVNVLGQVVTIAHQQRRKTANGMQRICRYAWCVQYRYVMALAAQAHGACGMLASYIWPVECMPLVPASMP